MSNSYVQCSNCGFMLSDLQNFDEIVECLKCSSTNRSLTVNETAKIHEMTKITAKDPIKTGKKKFRKEMIWGEELEVSSGKWMKKVRVIDVDNDRYFEEVRDLETDEVKHLKNHSLKSEHRGYGSAKFKTTPKGSLKG